jgi:hypothetical protein
VDEADGIAGAHASNLTVGDAIRMFVPPATGRTLPDATNVPLDSPYRTTIPAFGPDSSAG